MSLSLIQTITVANTSTNTIDFTNIPQTFTDLIIKMSIRTDIAGQIYDSVQIKFNGVNTNGTAKWIQGTGSSTSSAGTTVIADIFGNGTTSTASTYATSEIYIPAYTSGLSKSVSVDSSSENNATTIYTRLVGGTWASAAAINQVTLFLPNGSNFAVGATASLYGVNRITPSGSGATPNVEYLVVAGGGGGANAGSNSTRGAGAGGAGGLLTASNFSVASGSPITVAIGAGGAGAGTGSRANGSQGSSSSFSTISTVGGGYGSTQAVVTDGDRPGGAGGSGGGSGNLGGAGGSATSGQGFAGGAGLLSGVGDGGGGGGATSAGSNGTVSGTGALGGAGLATTITGNSRTLAAGGKGGSTSGAEIGATAGANTGNGGGGAGGTAGSLIAGGGGGSGVVIIRYPDIYANPTATTGNPVVNYSNGYKIYTWTSSGSITF